MRVCFFVVLLLALPLAGCSGNSRADILESDAPIETVDQAADIGGETTGCPDGQVPWPLLECAPAPTPCELPWELRRTDGSCLAIGPRACPAAWEPDEGHECVPGELVPCPEGFTLTQDEVACVPDLAEDCGPLEIPVPGGDCQPVGPRIEIPGGSGNGAETCPFGRIPVAGGGCLLVGARACGTLCDPEAQLDCELNELAVCPPGWTPNVDGLFCRPPESNCSAGHRVLFEGGCEQVLPGQEDCPEGPYPVPPDGNAEVAYVDDDSTCESGCGGIDQPFPTIQQALDATQPGGAILVAAGEYDEGVVIEKSVTLAGLCPALVTLSGTVSLAEQSGSKVESVGIGAVGVESVSISGIHVASPAVGIAVIGPGAFSLSRIEVSLSEGVGVFVAQKAEGTVDQLWVHDTGPSGKPGFDGTGLWAKDDAEAYVTNSLVEESASAGMYARGKGSLIDVRQTTVRGTKLSESGIGGFGIRARFYGKAVLEDVVLEGNRTAGLFVREFGKAEANGLIVRDTKTNGDEQGGYGIHITDRSKVTLNLVDVAQSHSAGLVLEMTGTEATVSRAVIRETMVAPGDDIAVGVLVASGSKLELLHSVVEKSVHSGLVAFDSETLVSVCGSLVRKTKPAFDNYSGGGISVADGAIVNVLRSVLQDNTSTGAAITGEGSELNLVESAIRATVPLAPDKPGLGLVGRQGALLTLTDCVVEDNTIAGVDIEDLGTQAVIAGSVVRNTLPADVSDLAYGLSVFDGAHVVVTDSLVDGNATSGIWAQGIGVEALVLGTVVRGTRAQEKNEISYGMMISSGARLFASGWALEDHEGIAVYGDGIGTELMLADGVIRNIVEPTFGSERSYALLVSGESDVTMERCLVEGARDAGLVFAEHGTTGVIKQTVVRSTVAAPLHGGGTGVLVHAAEVSMSGCLVETNEYMGLASGSPSGYLVIAGTIVRNNLPKVDRVGDTTVTQGGFGATTLLGARTDVVSSLFSGNASVGILAYEEGSQVNVWGSAVYDTLTGPDYLHGTGMQVFGDGLFAGPDTKIAIADTLVFNNARCGLYFFGSSGEIASTLVTANSSFGLVLEDCERDISYDDPKNQIVGNALDLPPAQAADMTTTPGGLTHPPMPKLSVEGEE